MRLRTVCDSCIGHLVDRGEDAAVSKVAGMINKWGSVRDGGWVRRHPRRNDMSTARRGDALMMKREVKAMNRTGMR